MNIITLTVNPALDKSAKIDGLVAEQKLKCHSIKYQAGGGGINISRILTRLNIDSDCVFTSGGDYGNYLEKLLLEEKVHITAIATEENTRENFSIIDTKTNLQYRFGMPGSKISTSELDLIIAEINKKVKEHDILALSGSLGEGMPVDFYSKIIKSLDNKRVKIILDTSGPALVNGLEQPVYLIKPNQKELALLAGKEVLTDKEQEEFAMQLVTSGSVKYVAVSLGAKGAFLASKEGVIYQSIPTVEVKSTIGAGDSMVAGLIFGIKQGYAADKMLKYGVACGMATTMSESTNLASASAIKSVLQSLK
ncbi:1-phosphofructokinase family hexose kinase [Lutibacter flavus]|uniref:6-phosphofructokinase 2 n=1 Tax=Lutibacter flavus TaxID=691689 RepID=A0A238VLD4_9FLAO|nr:1-phosphofructokinase family hexose kinase [Lutibacter flavus]SNR35165.1 6-phosphofructokinase 2 [Lutibacter flavus]